MRCPSLPVIVAGCFAQFLAMLVAPSVYADTPPAGYPATLRISLTGGAQAGTYQLVYSDSDNQNGVPGYEYDGVSSAGDVVQLSYDDPGNGSSSLDGQFQLGLADFTVAAGLSSPFTSFGAALGDLGTLYSFSSGQAVGQDVTASVTVPESSGVAAALIPLAGLVRRPRRQVR